MSKERIQQLLTAVGSKPAEDDAQVEVTEYNWKEPHYFNNEQLAKLNHFTEQAAGAMAQTLSMFCRGEFNVAVASMSQHYINNLLSQLSDGEQKDYYIPFGTDTERMCGLIGMPEQTALNWAKQLLGDSEPEKESGRELSQLEESLLLDLATVLIKTFCGSDGAFNFHLGQSIVRGRWPLEAEDAAELCKISFDVKKAESEKNSEIYFLILCSELCSVAGKAEQDSAELSAEDVSKMILGRLQEMPVFVTGQLASAVLTFEELMDLQADDILLLDNKIHQPMKLILDGRTIYYGYPAQSEGKYAVTITDTAAFEGAAESRNSSK